MIVCVRSESAWDNFGKFIHQFQNQDTYQETWKDVNKIIRGAFYKFTYFFLLAFKIVVDS